MIAGSQTGEHAEAAVVTAEVLFANVLNLTCPTYSIKNAYQNRRAQIELVEELSDEYVDLQNSLGCIMFHLLQHVNKPFEVLVRRAYPQEVQLKSKGVTINAIKSFD